VKRIIFILFVLAVLLLTACGGAQDETYPHKYMVMNAENTRYLWGETYGNCTGVTVEAKAKIEVRCAKDESETYVGYVDAFEIIK